ncbi:protein kinase [Ideonella sp. DXS29W]|uniref:Protein kinase n=1 Tax=Ideonella lacteola TaxID=2984193 RepID=A0ABU9BJB2_9BURK
MSLPDRERWLRLSPLLDELLDLPDEQRPAHLSRLQAQHPTLATELADLLGSHGDASSAQFLNGTAATAAKPSLAGQRLGPYVLISPIAQGGAGSVWRARRDDGRFEGEVAIKLLHMSLVGQAAAQRFRREGSILARLTHPHIARLLDAGVSDGGQPYLVLEWVDGERIDDHCDRLKLGVEQRLSLLTDVMSAVSHAHSHLVIHRDIKPPNILVDRSGQVKLLDFGIAKILQGESWSAAATSITRDNGGQSLTPEYAAPEQWLGETVTTATDVYALGVLMFCLLSGRHPTAPAGATVERVMRATLDCEPSPLGGACAPEVAAMRGTTARVLQRRLRGDLSNIAARALAKPPKLRYPTVDALAEDLRRYRAHEPVEAHARSWAYHWSKFARRHRVAVGAGVLSAVAITAGMIGTVSQARRAEQQAARAERERDRALREVAYTQSSGEFVSFLLQEGDEKPFTAEDLLARAETVVDQQFAGEPAQHAHLLLLVANLYGQAGLPAKSRPLLQRALQSAAHVRDAGLTAGIECQLAQDHAAEGDFTQARALLESALARLQVEGDGDPSKRAICLQARSEVATRSGDAQAALADARAAIETMPKEQLGPTGRYGEMAVVLQATLASALNKAGQPAEAVQASRRAIDALLAMGRGRTRQAVGLYNNLGVQLSRGGQTAEAEKAIQQALAISRGFGNVEPRLEGNYAIRLVDLGRGHEAVPLLQHAIREIESQGDKRSGAVLMIQGAQAWCQSGDLTGCERELDWTESRLKAIAPSTSATFSGLAMSRAQLALRRHRPGLAADLLKQAVDGFDAARDQSRMGIRALSLLARTQVQLGDLNAARSTADRAVNEAQASLAGFGHSEWLGSALAAKALVHQARGERLEAQQTRQQALEHLQATLNESSPALVELREQIAQDAGAS